MPVYSNTFMHMLTIIAQYDLSHPKHFVYAFAEPLEELNVVSTAAESCELTKAEVREFSKTSAVARTALFHWNRMNTTVRRLVHSKQVGC